MLVEEVHYTLDHENYAVPKRKTRHIPTTQERLDLEEVLVYVRSAFLLPLSEFFLRYHLYLVNLV